MSESRLLLLALGLALAGLVGLPPASVGADEKRERPGESADSITPIAASIKTIKGAEVTLAGKKVAVSIPYARAGNTLFPLPVWLALGKPELLTGSDKVRRRVCEADRALLQLEDELPVRLRIVLSNLLATEGHRKVIFTRLKEEIAELDGVKNPTLRLEEPRIDENGYHLTLCASGSGGGALAGEVQLSRPAAMPPQVARNGGEVVLELLPEALALLQADKGRPVLLGDTYLKVEGAVKARFEREDYRANFTVVRRQVTGLQNRLRSLVPSATEPPEVFVRVPTGGEVEHETTADAVFTQCLVGTVSVRAGANRDPGAIQELAGQVLGKVLEQVRLNDLEDKKRVAILLGNQVAVSATMGEIKGLAKATRTEREAKLKSALEDWEARRNGEEREHKGSLGVEAEFSGSVGNRLVGAEARSRYAGKLDAATRKKLEQEEASRRSRALETAHRGLDELKKHFDGRIPTLTGIQFNEKGLNSSLDSVEVELKKNTFTTGWSHHEWPALSFRELPAEVISPELLAGQLSAARQRFEEFEKLLAKKDELKELAATLERVEEMTRKLKEASEWTAELPRARARFEEVKKLLAEAEKDSKVVELRKRLATLDELHERVDGLAISLLPPAGFRHEQAVLGAAFTPDGRRLLTSSRDKTVRLWDLSTGREIHRLEGHEGWVPGVAVSPDGLWALSGSEDESVRLWDLTTGKQARLFKGHKDLVRSVAFSPDGKQALSGGDDGTLRLWDIQTGKEVKSFKGHDGWVFGVAFAPDGKHVASSGKDLTVRIWEVESGKEVHVLKGHENWVRGVAFAPDGKYLVSGGEDESVRVWEVASGRPLLVLKGHKDLVRSVCFSANGRFVVSAGDDKTVRIWDARTGAEVSVVAGAGSAIHAVACSPKFAHVAAGCTDGSVRLSHAPALR